jgi:hypothetical protein
MVLGFTFVFIIFLITSSPSLVGGDSEKPDWEVGDKWNYDMSVMGMSVPVTYKVSDITSIDVNGTDYDVYDMEIKGTGGTQHMYYLTSDLALVKTQIPSMGGDSPMISSYDPPKIEFDFPLAVGKTWNSTSIQSVTGGGFDPANLTLIETYNVVRMESITVEAGTFECYRIESMNDNELITTTRWYSEEVRNVVKSTVNISSVNTEMELKSYSFKGEGDGSDDDALPEPLMFLIIPIIIVVLIVGLLLSGKRKKTQKESAPPPEKRIPPPPQKQKPPAGS